jgi:hypothetical protein
MTLRAGISGIVGLQNQSSAEFVDGSLMLQGSKSQKLDRTPSSAGNTRIWTFSCWMKKLKTDDGQDQIFVAGTGPAVRSQFYMTGDSLAFYHTESPEGTNAFTASSSNKLRDVNGWYHLLLQCDITSGYIKCYVNNKLEFENTSVTTSYITQYNKTHLHTIGNHSFTDYNNPLDAQFSNIYFIDGQALEPTDFGFTDGLTGTWRPKKFKHLNSAISTQYSGASTLTWDDSPIGSIYTLSNGNKTATAGGGGNGYPNADVWSIAIPANSTYAWTLDITNGDNVGGWYFTDAQTASGTHADERGGNSLGMRPGETHAGYYGTFASANGGSDGQSKISMPGASAGPGFARVDFVVYRPASGTGKVWVKNNGSSSWVGGGNPSNTSSTPSFIIPDGTTYFGFTFYDRTNDQIATFDGDGSILQKAGGNSYYLPMDGNSPIGEDQSGRANNWIPKNFGGSNSIDKATGALPILNTTQGGTQATIGVRTDTVATSINAGQVWSNNPTVSGGSLSNAPDGFDGSIASSGAHCTLTATSSSAAANATFAASIPNVTKVEVFVHSASSSGDTRGTCLDTDGVTHTSSTLTSASQSFHTIYEGDAITLANVGWGINQNGATGTSSDAFRAFRVNGYILKNSTSSGEGLTLAIPFVGTRGDISHHINSGSAEKSLGASGDPAANSDDSNFYAESFEFDGDDYVTITNTSELVIGTGDFTVEFWYKVTASFAGDNFYVFDFNDNGLRVQLLNNTIAFGTGSSYVQATVNGADTNSWHHIAVQRSGSNCTLYYNGVNVATMTSSEDISMGSPAHIGQYGGNGHHFTGYLQDFRVYKGVAKYNENFIPAATSPDILPDTPSGVTGGSKLTKITDGAVHFDGTGDFLSLANSTDTNFGSGDFTIECCAYFTSVSAETLVGQWEPGTNRRSWLLQVNSGTLSSYLSPDGTSSSLKQINAAPITTNRWYHLAFARSGDTMRMFIDGKLAGSSVDVSGFTNYANTNDGFQVGSQTTAGANLMSGFISNVRIIKGTGLYTGNFIPPSAPLTNVTNTKLLCCQSNTSATEGAVKPGTITANGDAVATNFNPFNTDINTVRGQETGYATWNPLKIGGTVTLSEGNLKASMSGGTHRVEATKTFSSGKFYWEGVGTNTTNGTVGGRFSFCLSNDFADPESSGVPTFNAYWHPTAGLYIRGSLVGSTTQVNTNTYADGDVLAWAVDADNRVAYTYKNGVLNHTLDYSSYVSADIQNNKGLTPHVWNGSSGTPSWVHNFGQKPFKFPPPDGFQPLNAANTRPSRVIARPNQFVGVEKYTSGDGSAVSVDSYNFAPDLIFIKDRDGTNNWSVFDTVSGYANRLDTTGAGGYQDWSDYFGSFDPNGFTVKAATSDLNRSTNKMCSWSWKAGGNKNTFNVDDVGFASAAAAGLNGGTITPTGASVGTKQGFSIVKWTGTGSAGTVPHALGNVPRVIIGKKVSGSNPSENWQVYHHNSHATLSQRARLELNTTGKVATNDSYWNDTAPTSSVFSISNGYLNENGSGYIAYLWCDVPGLQKFGSYTGNGLTDGPFIELGFRPAVLITKRTDSTDYWYIFDTARDVDNVVEAKLEINTSAAEHTSTDWLDILSDGFKLRSTGGDVNTSGGSYIYFAWAEAPASNLFGGQSNAR